MRNSPNNQISIHALLAESDSLTAPQQLLFSVFLSTLSLRRATANWFDLWGWAEYFYPRSPCGERRLLLLWLLTSILFLSTLSLRRATLEIPRPCLAIHNFYPRSPCGERLSFSVTRYRPTPISIHALLAESDWDWFFTGTLDPKFLSTLSLRRATCAL